MKYLVLVFALMLSGCVTKYVVIPSHLTEPFEVLTPKEVSVEEAVNLANARGEIIEQCNMRLLEISEVQGTEVP